MGDTEYTYDVFISYRRKPTKSEWLKDHFLPLFEGYLDDEIVAQCGRSLRKIFFDETEVDQDLRKFEQTFGGIEPGADWRKALEEAIRRSCCMVGVWSPNYFLSEWCNLEWESFERRAATTSKITVVPVTVHDGKYFPPKAKARQLVDLSEYMIVGEGFKKTEKYVDFQNVLKNLARSVAATVKNAPAYQVWGIQETTTAQIPPTIGLTTFEAK